MHGQLTVEPGDLRGWADQVERAGGDCGYLQSYVATFVPDGDFGRLLTVIEHDYERLARRLGETLDVDASRLRETGATLHQVAWSYERTDALAAQGLDTGLDTGPGTVTGTGHSGSHGQGSGGFVDVAASRPRGPTCSPVSLPSLSLGATADAGLDLYARLGGPDLRQDLATFCGGDLDKALRQASVWEDTSTAIAGVRENLAHGALEVSIRWEGAAATTSHAYTRAWVDALGVQSETMTRLAGYLRDAVTMAVDVAQVFFDAVRFIVTAVLAGWTSTCIPIFGPFKAARSLKELLEHGWRARKVLALFAAFLTSMKDALVGCVDALMAEPLPAPPGLPGRAA